MAFEYEITKQHLAGDEEHVSFTIRFGPDLKKATISRTALVQLDGIGGRSIFLVFEDNHDVIADAAYAKWLENPTNEFIRLGSDAF